MTSYQSILPFTTQRLTQAHMIKSDQEALDIAKLLAEKFKQNAIQRDAERQ